MPGEADISCYVNFEGLKGIGKSADNVKVLGPLP